MILTVTHVGKHIKSPKGTDILPSQRERGGTWVGNQERCSEKVKLKLSLEECAGITR